MSKVRKSILIIGILIIVIAASLATALALLATGTIKTDPIELVYSVKDAEKVYDGSPLKATEYRLTSGALGEGHTAQVEILGEQTAVGTSKSDLSVKIYDKEGYNVSNNYSIKVVSGDLTVTKKSIKIDLPSQKAIYNGSTVALTNYRVTEDSEGDLVAGHKIYGSTDAGLLNVGDTVPEDLTPLVFDVAGNNVTENYEIEFTVGEIEVVPRYISVRPVSISKVYDGETIVADKIEFVEGSVVEGQRIEYKINDNLSNELRDAGYEEMRVTSVSIFATVDGEEVDVTENYEIDTFETGALEITPRPLTVTALSGSWIYDGNAHTLREETQPYSVEGLAPSDSLIDMQYSGAITDVGVAVNLISNVSLSCYSENYDIKIVNGTLTVTPFELTIKTASAEKYYDGEALKDEEIEAVPAEGQTVAIAANASFPEITDAGSIVNEFECRVLFNDRNVTENYKITYDYGTLTVNKLPVTVALGNDESVVYNGAVQRPALNNKNYFNLKSVDDESTQTLNRLLSGSDFDVVSYSKSMKNVGVYTYSVRFRNKDYNANYTLEVPDNGYFTIQPKPLAITTGDGSQVYSGAPLTNGDFKISEATGKVINHAVSAPAQLPSITDVGEISNAFAVTVADENGEDVTGNYGITYDYGKLTVTPLEIKVTLKSEITHTYNGRAAVVTPEEAITNIERTDGNALEAGVIDKSDFTVVFEEEAVNVKLNGNNYDIYDYTVVVTDAKFGNNFTLKVVGDVAGNNRRGVKVLPADISVKIKDIKQVYDSEAHLLDVYTAIYSVEDKVTGLTRDDFSVSFQDGSVKLTDAGAYPYTVKLSEEKADNYSVTVTNAEGRTATNGNFPAEYVINPFVVDVTTASKTFVYDGTAHSCGDFTHTPLANRTHTINHQLTVENLPAVTDVKEGSKQNNINSALFAVYEGETPLTHNYDIKVKFGTLNVVPCAVTVYTPDAEQVYNGEALSKTDNVRLEGAQGSGFTAEYSEAKTPVIPEITNVGELTNEFGCVIELDGKDVTANFDVTVKYGTLRVTPLKVKVTLNNLPEIGEGKAIIYNGEEKQIDIEDAVASIVYDADAELITNDNLQLVYGSIIDAGEYTYTAKFADGVDVNNFELEVADGTVTVEKMSVIVNLNYYIDEDALTFDNTEKTIDESYIEDITDDYGFGISETLLPKSALAFTVTGGKVIKYVDTYSYSAYLADEQYTKNIEIMQCDAKTIEVAPLEVNVTLKNYTEEENSAFTFDNTEKTIDLKEVLTVDTNLLTYTDFEVAVDGNKTIKNSGNYAYKVKFVDEDYAKNFAIVDEDNVIGEVEVSKLTVNVTPDDYVFTYNGEVQTVKVRDALVFDSDLVKPASFVLEYKDGASNVVDEVIKAGDYRYTAKVAENLPDEEIEYLNNFNLQFSQGNITVKKLGVILTLGSFTRVYDGNEYIVNPETAVVADTYLLKSDDLVIKYKGKNATTDAYEEVSSIKNAGDYQYTVALTTDVNNENAKNFEIKATHGSGTITVEKLEVKVQLSSLSTVYNGEEYNLNNSKNEIINGCVIDTTLLKTENFSFAYVQGGNVDVGSHAFTASLPATDENNNFKLNVSYGSVVVTPRPVTITVAGDTKVYDGKELTKDEASAVTLANAAVGHSAVVTNSVSITDVGSVPNALICTISDEHNVDVTANYEITYNYGDLEITPLGVTVELSDFTGEASLVYTGERQSFELDKVIELTCDEPDLISVTDFEIVCDRELINAGSYTYTVRYKGKSENFDFGNIAVGQITINKKELEVSIASFVDENALTYIGSDYANLYLTDGVWKRDNVTVVTENYHNFTGDDFRFVYSGEMKNVGTYKFGVEFANAANNENYTFTVQVGSGIMQIVPLAINVTLNDFTGDKAFTYNGKKVDIDVNAVIQEIALADTVDEIAAQNIEILGGIKNIIRPNEFYIVTTEDIIKVKGTEQGDGSFTYGSYDYSVKITSAQSAKNFNVTCANADGEESGKVEVHKRRISITLGDLVTTTLVADGYNSRFLVTNLVSISGATPLADGDFFVVTEAYADGEDVNYSMTLDVGSLEYTLTNKECYELDFSNTTAHVTILSPSN